MIMKILLCIILLLVVLTLFAVWPGKRRDALRAPFLGRNCAHRGFFGKDQRPPENSLPAFAAAAKNGYGIELDVQFTADRRLVVFHDDTLDRMTPAKALSMICLGQSSRPSRWPAATSTRLCLPICCAPSPRPTPTRR